MNKNQFKYFLLLVWMVLFQTITISQIKIHKHLTVNDGLVHSQITSLMQDSKGYMWIGTLGGLSRWDGIKYKNYYTHNGLPSSRIMDIAETSDGTIFLAAYGGGVLKIKNDVMDTISISDGLLNNNISQIEIDKNGNLFFFGNSGSISILKDGKIHDYGSKINFPKYDIWDAKISKSGILYCATQNGLVIVKNDSIKILNSNDGLLADLIWSVSTTNDSVIYVGTNRGINKIKNGLITTVQFKKNPIVSPAFKIHIVQNKKIYFATKNGIYIKDKNEVTQLEKKHGLSSNDNWTLTADENGTLYFGSNGSGISIYDPNESIVNFTKESGLEDEKIISITEDNFGSKFFGTKTGLVKLKNNKLKKYFFGKDRRSNIIDVLYKNQKGEILLGTKNGLKIFENNSIKNYKINSDLPITEIFSIGESENGELYFSTSYGVYSLIDNKVKRIKYFDNFSSNYIMTILVLENSEIYFGSFDMGLFVYKNNQYIQLTTKEGLSDNSINCFLQMEDSRILIGTQNGINILEDYSIIDTIDINDGLSNNAITGINKNKNGKLFISTYKGINIITNFDEKQMSIRKITHDDGLVYDNCINGASFLDRDEKLWIGTAKGVSNYNSKVDKSISRSPKIYLTGLEIFNEEYSIDKLVKEKELDYNQNYLKFIYTGINLSSPKKIGYKYKLKGVDKDWIDSKDSYANYTNLDKGKYSFEVKAQNEWGYWSEPSSISFVINPAWWNTWWFRLLVISFLGLLLWLIFQYRLNYLIKLERLRSNISEDLHDNIGSCLSLISILTSLMDNQVSGEKTEVKESLKKVNSISDSLIESMSDIVWLINPQKKSLQELILRIRSSYHEILEFSQIDFVIENIDALAEISLPLNYRQNLYLILKEVVNNSIKYSEADLLQLEINIKKNILEIIFTDNGKGFEIEKIKFGNGLKNIKKRADAIGAKLDYFSKLGKGTKITFNGRIK